jgi:phage terminase Nu1 subunit (DNA packaging protein)
MSQPIGDAIVDRATLAAVLGVSEIVIMQWEAEGMPTVAAADPRPVWTPPKNWVVNRVEVAKHLGVHPDSVSRLVAQSGLDAALVKPGGHGKAMTFDLRRVCQWDLERKAPGITASFAKDDAAAQTFVRLLVESLPETANEEQPAPAPTPRRTRRAR